MFSPLHYLFSAPTPPPADVRVVPCTGLDLCVRKVVLTTGFVIDARLDTKKLEDSLALLVERKFPRAGARLALRNDVRLVSRLLLWGRAPENLCRAMSFKFLTHSMRKRRRSRLRRRSILSHTLPACGLQSSTCGTRHRASRGYALPHQLNPTSGATHVLGR
jgi:hypothetical protein